jgi:hypothetical protein
MIDIPLREPRTTISKKIVRLPGQTTARRRIDQHERRIRCEVSPRWIQFSQQIDRHADQDYLRLAIMTLDAGEKTRTLCELIIDPREFQKLLSSLPVKDWRRR